MSFLERHPLLRPETRASAYYFTFYLGPGAAVVFLSIWLSEMGLTPDQIGMVNAVPVLATLVLSLLVGRLADRAKDWRDVIIVGSIIGAVAPMGLFFANDFWSILLVWTVAMTPIGLINPILDAALLRMTRRNGTHFGHIRVWGTAGATLMNMGVGILVAWLGSGIFVPLFVFLVVVRALVSIQLPRFRAPAIEPTLAQVAPGGSGLSELMRPWFVLPLLGFALISGTHGLLGGIGALLLKQQGISSLVIGALIALGTVAEAVMMVSWKRIAHRWPARALLVIAGLIAALRWGAMAFSPPIIVLIVLQMLNGVTFGLALLAGLNFVTNWTREENAAEAMSLFNILNQTIGMVLMVAFGFAVAAMGSYSYLLAAGLAAIGAACAAISLKLVSASEHG